MRYEVLCEGTYVIICRCLLTSQVLIGVESFWGSEEWCTLFGSV